MSSATERYFDRSERVPDTWAPNNSDCVPETWTSELQSHGRVGGSAWSSFSNPSATNLRAQDGGARHICRPVPTYASGSSYGEDTCRSIPIHEGGSSCSEDPTSNHVHCRGAAQQ